MNELVWQPKGIRFFVSIEEAAMMLGVPYKRMKKAVRDGEVQSYKMGRRTVITPEAVKSCELNKAVRRLDLSLPKGRGVYFLLSPTVGLVKIGYASDFDKRITALQTTCPEELTVLCTVHSAHPRRCEGWFHSRFSKHRVRFEWFDVTREEIIRAVSDWESMQ